MGDGSQIGPEVQKKLKAGIVDPVKADNYPDMPIDDPQAFIDWHKDHFSTEAVYAREMAGDDVSNMTGYTEDDYSELTPEVTERLLKKALSKIGGGVSLYRMKQFLADTPLGELIAFGVNDEPFVLPEVQDRLTEQARSERTVRITAYPEVQRLANADQTTIRYVSAVDSEYAKNSFKNGFEMSMASGLKSKANLLGVDREENLEALTHPHRDRRAFVVLKFSQLPEELRERAHALRIKNTYVDPGTLLANEFEEIQEGAKLINDAVVPARFIEGWLNLKTGKYERNMEYNPEYTEDDLKKIDERLRLLEGGKSFWEEKGQSEGVKIEL